MFGTGHATADRFDISVWRATFYDKGTERAFLERDSTASIRPITVTILLLNVVILVTFILDYNTFADQAPELMYQLLIARVVSAVLCLTALLLLRKTKSLFFKHALLFGTILVASAMCVFATLSYAPFISSTNSPVWYSAALLFALTGFPVPTRVALVYALLPVSGAVAHQVYAYGTPLYCPDEFATLMIAFGAIGAAVSIRENLVRRKNFVLLREQQSINERLSLEVSERKRVEALLNVRKDQLETHLAEAQRLESVALLTGGIAHDFNNLLLPIMGFAEMAERKLPKGSPVLPFLAQITQAAQRAKDMTRQLLAFGRKQLLDVKQVDLNELIRGLEGLAERLIREDIEVTVELEERLRPVVADPSQIEQILMNLIVNARDAMPGGGSMRIATTNVSKEDVVEDIKMPSGGNPAGGFVKDCDEWARISVTDSGTGIDPQVVHRIFDPFFTTKPKEEGTGLGLAMVYGIVSQHGGRISVDSVKEEGTTIHIYLPSGTKTASSAAETPTEVEDLNGDETVLLVEDEAVVREYVREVLEGYGYTVVSAANGQDALTIGNDLQDRIHLLITDVVMPKLSGAQLWRRLSEERKDMKVLFISGYPNEDLGHHGVITEGVHLLSKPFEAEELALKIRQTLSSEEQPLR